VISSPRSPDADRGGSCHGRGVTTYLGGARILIAGATGGSAPGSRAGPEVGGAAGGPHRPGRDERAEQLARQLAVQAHGGLDEVWTRSGRRGVRQVFAAGVVAFGPVSQLDQHTLRTFPQVGVVAPVQLLRSANPFLLEAARWGCSAFMVNPSAVVAEQPMAGMARAWPGHGTAAGKAALTAFDAAASREVRGAGSGWSTSALHTPGAGLPGGRSPVLPSTCFSAGGPGAVAARIVPGDRER